MISNFQTTEDLKEINDRSFMYKELEGCFHNPELSKIKDLVFSEDFKSYCSIHYVQDTLFKMSFIKGNKRVVDFLINEYEMELTPAIFHFLQNKKVTSVLKQFQNRASIDCPKEKVINRINSLLLKSYPIDSIHTIKIYLNTRLQEAVMTRNTIMIDFLLSKDTFASLNRNIEPPSIYNGNDAITKQLCVDVGQDMPYAKETLYYLLAEKNLQKTKVLHDFLLCEKQQEIINWFDKRDLNQKLDIGMGTKITETTRVKI